MTVAKETDVGSRIVRAMACTRGWETVECLQENISHVAGLVRLICLMGVVSEILPPHFFVRNFKDSEFSRFFISVI